LRRVPPEKVIVEVAEWMVTVGSEPALRGTRTKIVVMAANIGHTTGVDGIRFQAGLRPIRRRGECGSYGQGTGEQFAHPFLSSAGLVAT
jgi:hypothetical protein